MEVVVASVGAGAAGDDDAGVGAGRAPAAAADDGEGHGSAIEIAAAHFDGGGGHEVVGVEGRIAQSAAHAFEWLQRRWQGHARGHAVHSKSRCGDGGNDQGADAVVPHGVAPGR